MVFYEKLKCNYSWRRKRLLEDEENEEEYDEISLPYDDKSKILL